MAILAGLGKVYEAGPVFRAEPSFSSRHATEFQGLDIEKEGVKSEYELVALECEMLRAGMAKTIAAMGQSSPRITQRLRCQVPRRL
jgi:aspartyl/asparaginyl-tRNA synthetase